MKKQLLKTALSVLALPLLMGNAPAPYPTTVKIEKFECSGLTYEKFEEIDVISTKISNLEETAFIRSCYLEMTGGYYGSQTFAPNELIAPNTSKEVMFLVDDTNDDLNDYKMTCEGYNELNHDLYKYKGATNWTKTYRSRDYNYISRIEYSFELEFEPLQKFDNYYPVVLLHYNDEDHYIVSDNSFEGNPSKDYSWGTMFWFETLDDININEVEIKDVFAVKGNSYYDKNHKGHYGGIALMLITIAEIVGGAIVLGGLVVGLIFLIKAIVKKNKSKKQSEN